MSFVICPSIPPSTVMRALFRVLLCTLSCNLNLRVKGVVRSQRQGKRVGIKLEDEGRKHREVGKDLRKLRRGNSREEVPGAVNE